MFRLTKKIITILDRKQKIKLFFGVILMLIGGVMESIGVSLILPLVATISNGSNWNKSWYSQLLCNIFNISSMKDYIILLLVLLILVFIFKNLFLLYERLYQADFIANSRFNLQKDLINKYIKMPYEFFTQSTSGEIIRIITSDTVQTYTLLSGIMTFYTELFVCIMIAIVLIYMDPAISLFFIVLMIIEALLLSKIINPIMERIGNEDRNHHAEANKWMINLIEGIKSIKVADKGDYFINKHNEHANITVQMQKKNQALGSFPKIVLETVTVIAVLLLILLMVVSGKELDTLIPTLSSFAIAALRLLPSITTITSTVNSVSYLEGSLDSIIDVLNKEDETDYIVDSNKNETIDFHETIDFNDVSFKYSNTKNYIIKNCTFEINSGESVGIVGESGAGKTTTIDIVLGLLKPSKGKVLVDGIDIQESMSSWLNNLSYIPQQIFLMNDTIRTNVAFGIDEEKVSDKEVWRALKEAKLESYVKRLPNKLDTVIGENGMRLSGGQRQRIGIARALYTNPKLLVFDEATSALDNETEKAIMTSIDSLKGKKTMIIIAHRLTTIENCDKVYRVINKNIVREK